MVSAIGRYFVRPHLNPFTPTGTGKYSGSIIIENLVQPDFPGLDRRKERELFVRCGRASLMRAGRNEY